MHAWAEISPLPRAPRRGAAYAPTTTTSRTSTASPATRASPRCWPPAASSCRGATPPTTRRGDRVRARQPQERRCSARCSPATASRPTPARSSCSTRLDERGTRMAIVSSSANAPDVLRAAGLLDRFETVVDGAVAKEQEPARQAGARHLRSTPPTRSASPTERAVVVEDAVSGVQAGAAGDFGLVVGVDRGAGADALRDERRRPRRGRPRRAGRRTRREREDAMTAGAAHTPPRGRDPLDRHVFPIDPWRAGRAALRPRHLGRNETLFAVGQRLPRHARQRRGGPRQPRRTAPTSTASTRPSPIQHAEEAFGFARVGQTMVNVPDSKLIRLYVDDEPLLLSIADLEQLRPHPRLPRPAVLTRSPGLAHARRQAGAGRLHPDGLDDRPPPRGDDLRGHAARRATPRWRCPRSCSTGRTARTSTTSAPPPWARALDPRKTAVFDRRVLHPAVRSASRPTATG